jgi:serine/threonine-protein kinase
MGIVYKAFHPELKRVVALKVLIAGENASEEAIARFHREAEAVARLGHHPNIVPVYDIGQVEEAGRPPLHYIAMHFVEGSSLDRAMDEEAIPPPEAARIAWKIALALRHAHEHGILHRDIKPSNILMADPDYPDGASRQTDHPDRAAGARGTGQGADPVAKPASPDPSTREGESGIGEPMLTDFGLAKDVESDSKMTRTGVAFGTPHYMPPEQADGRHAEVGVRSDVYSLGATLYEMLTLRTPFQGSGPAEVLRHLLTAEPDRPRRWNAEVPRDLETICLKCLEKDPAKRYASAEALADDLRRFLDGAPILARPITAWERTRRRIGRHRAATASVLAAAVLLAAGAAAAAWIAAGGRREAEESRASEREAVGEKDRAESLLRKNQAVSTVLLGAQGKLGGVHREFKRLHYDSAKLPAEKARLFAARDAEIAAFLERAPADPAGRAAALAVKGWLLRLRGDPEAALAAFALARETDPDVAWGPFLEAVHWFAAYVLQRPIPRYRMGLLGLAFGEVPPETSALRAQRERFEACAAEVAKAQVWGGDSASAAPAVSRGLLAIREGRLDDAQRAIGEVLDLLSMSWVEEELLLIRARVRYLAKDFAGSEKDLLLFLERCPDHAGARLLLGGALEGRGCEALAGGQDPRPGLRAAVEAYGEGIRLKPEASEGWRQRATVLRFLASAEERLGEDPRPSLKAAVEDARKAVSQGPNAAANHSCLGAALLERSREDAARGADPRPGYSEALEVLGRAVGMDPSSANARERLAWTTVCLGVAEEERGADPREIWRDAIRIYDDAVRAVPGDTELRNGRGNAWQKLGEAELERSGAGAEEAFRNAARDHEAHLALDPSSPVGHVHLGNAWKSLGDVRARRGEDPREEFGKAVAAFEKSLRIHEGFHSARINMGNALLALGTHEAGRGVDPRPTLRRAAEVVQGYVERQPANAEGHLRLGMILSSLGEASAARGDDPNEFLERAVEAFTAAAERNPRLADAFAHRAAARMRAGEFAARRGADPRPAYAKALEDFRLALDLNPGSPQVWANMGVVHYNAGDAAAARGEDPRASYAAAVETQTEALKRSPNSQAALNNRGNARTSWAAAEAARGGDPRAELRSAIEDFDRVLAANPGYVGGTLNRARALMQLGETGAAWGADPEPLYLAALAGYEAAAAANKNLWQAHANRGLVLERLGRFPEAVEAYAAADSLLRGTSKAVREWLERARTRAALPPWTRKLVHGAIMFGVSDYPTARKALEGGLEEARAVPPADRPADAASWVARAHCCLAAVLATASTGRAGPRADPNPPPEEEAAALREKSLDQLDEALANGWDDLGAIAAEKAFAPLKDHPRFRALLERRLGGGR